METIQAARRWIAAWESAWPAEDVDAIASVYRDGPVYSSHPFRERESARAYLERAFGEEELVRAWFGEPVVVGQGAILQRADHVSERTDLAVANNGKLGDRIALHDVDRLADFLVRRDRDKRRHLRLLDPLRAQQLCNGRLRHAPLDQAVLEHPVVVVELRHVRASGVRQHCEDRRVRPETLRDLHRRPNRRSAGATGE